MAGSVYNLDPREFRQALATGQIGLCEKCLIHAGGPRCPRCRRRLIGTDGAPFSDGREFYTESSPTEPRPAQMRYPPPPEGSLFKDGTGPECLASHSSGVACQHYRYFNLAVHCAQAHRFIVTECRMMMEKKGKT